MTHKLSVQLFELLFVSNQLKAHFVDTAMKRLNAKEFCESLGRTLPMPTNLEEQRFFEAFAKKRMNDQPDIRIMKDMKVQSILFHFK